MIFFRFGAATVWAISAANLRFCIRSISNSYAKDQPTSQTKLWTYLDIVHEKCTETIWAHVTCSFVWTVTDGRHDVHTLESSTNSIVDTTGFTPVRLERDPRERDRTSSRRTRRRKYRSLWWRTNFFVRFLRIFPLTRGRSFVDVAAIMRTNDDLKRMPMQVMTFFSVYGRKIALDWSSARSRFYSSRRCDFVIIRIFSYKNKSTKITRLFFDIHSFSLLLTGTGTSTARTIVGWATTTVSGTLDKHKSIILLSGSTPSVTYEFWSRRSGTDVALFVITTGTAVFSLTLLRWRRWASCIN